MHGVALLIGVSMSAGPANAVVYCKTVGVPKGCVARPAVGLRLSSRRLLAPLSIARRAVSPRLHYAMTACGTKLTCHPVERVSSRPGQPRRQALIGALAHHYVSRRHQPMLAWKKADRNRKFTPAKGLEATEAWNWFQTLTGLRRFFQMRCASFFLGAIAAFRVPDDVTARGRQRNTSKRPEHSQIETALRLEAAWHFVRSRAVRAC